MITRFPFSKIQSVSTMSSPPATPRSKDPKSESEWRFHSNGTPCEWEESYHPGGYHPIHILDTFNGRYRVLRKLGYGSFSTVWLAVDLRSSRYIALKVLIASSDHQSVSSGDLLVHDRLQSATDGDYSLHIVSLYSTLSLTTAQTARIYVLSMRRWVRMSTTCCSWRKNVERVSTGQTRDGFQDNGRGVSCATPC